MKEPAQSDICFFERDPQLALARRAGAEAVGTLLLMFAATASAVVASGFGAPSPAAMLLHALATSGALVGLIIAFGAVSGGHFNPIITAMQWLAGQRTFRCTLAYVVAQLLGAIAGAALARVTFETPPPSPTLPEWSLVASEVVATAGLMIIIFGSSRAKRSEAGPFAVGAWLTGMIVYMPSSYANPALVVGALFAVGPITLPAWAMVLFVPAQIVGGLLALWIVMLVYGDARRERRDIDSYLKVQ